jgi:hypothetical protein
MVNMSKAMLDKLKALVQEMEEECKPDYSVALVNSDGEVVTERQGGKGPWTFKMAENATLIGIWVDGVFGRFPWPVSVGKGKSFTVDPLKHWNIEYKGRTVLQRNEDGDIISIAGYWE